MITLENALATLFDAVKPIERTRYIPLEESAGRRAVLDIYAPIDMPPFNRSPLDGYALRSADISDAAPGKPVKLTVVAEIPAGSFWDGTVEAGQTVRIMTGGMLPDGADCVVKQEDTDDGEEAVMFYGPMRPMQNICFKGEDVKKGALILPKDSIITYAHLGVLASVGLSRLLVRDKVRCGILSTGDELTPPGEFLERGKIYNSNLFMLTGRIEGLGYDVTALYKVGDDIDEVCGIIDREVDGVDVLFTTGGVSVGRRDIMPAALKQLGARILFWRVALKPGTPVLAAVYRDKLLLCLSGNPFAAITNFELLGRPVLSKLSGSESLGHKRVAGVMADAFPKASPERRFIRAVYKNGQVYLPAHNHSSGALMSLIGCNALLDIPAGSPGLTTGQAVELIILEEM